MLYRSMPAFLVLAFVACGGGGGANPAGPGAPATPTIGPAGGTVVASDNGARLVVPAGALGAEVPLVIRPATGVPLDPHAVSRASYEIAPPGTTFATPATLTLRYDPNLGPSGTAESEWRVHVQNGAEWEPVQGGTVDAGAHQATSPVRASGTFVPRWTGPSAACGSAHDREFDFWVGSWSFAAPGSLPGTNDITSEASGCLVEEHFRDSSGTQGRSVSLFSRLDGQWHQTYVDSRGAHLVLVGAFDGRRMVLAESATQRYLWEQIGADTVRYWGERSADGGASFSVFFDSTYTRR